MNYFDGREVRLGDLVEVSTAPGESSKGRIVMLGENYSHIAIELAFLEWVQKDKVLDKNALVIEWIEANPLAHVDPRYAPVGNYIFAALDAGIMWIETTAIETS